MKKFLPKTLKMSLEEFRQIFFIHKKKPTEIWRDFGLNFKPTLMSVINFVELINKIIN